MGRPSKHLRIGPEQMLMLWGPRALKPLCAALGPSDANGGFGNWFQRHAGHRWQRCGRTYLERSLLRCFFVTSPSAGRARRASSACLASLSARRRAMFLRIAAAFCSTSIIARAPSSWASLRRLARATLTGDGSADFLLTIFPDPDSQASKPAQSWDRAGTLPFQYIREMA
jgi:hypothetical protein